MQDDTTRLVADEERQMDQAILALLLVPEEQRPWSVDEVKREIGEPLETVDSLARLHGAGLIHRFGEFVFASRAALTAEKLLL